MESGASSSVSVWRWLDRADTVLSGEDDPLAAFINLKRLFRFVDARPARARDVGKDHAFKREMDETETRALFPSNYPPIPA
jgi:GST-like protein